MLTEYHMPVTKPTSCRWAAVKICLRPPASWQYLHIYSPGGT